MAGLHVRASAPVPDTADIAAIVAAAGGELKHAKYDNGVLTVRGVEQADLDAAIAGGVDILFAARSGKFQAIEEALATRLGGGMPWRGEVLQLTPDSMTDMTSAALAANLGALPAGFAWRMASNDFLPMTPAQMIEMATAAFGYVYASYVHYWTLKGAVAAADDGAELAAIDPAAGWPAPAVPTP